MQRMKLAMEQLAKKRAAAVADLHEATKDPMKVQEAFLLKLIQDNKKTEYGKKHGFESIHSIEDFQRQVPITTYDDYAPYIERMSEQGERDLITSYPVFFYNKTSGRASFPKRSVY